MENDKEDTDLKGIYVKENLSRWQQIVGVTWWKRNNFMYFLCFLFLAYPIGRFFSYFDNDTPLLGGLFLIFFSCVFLGLLSVCFFSSDFALLDLSKRLKITDRSPESYEDENGKPDYSKVDHDEFGGFSFTRGFFTLLLLGVVGLRFLVGGGVVWIVVTLAIDNINL